MGVEDAVEEGFEGVGSGVGAACVCGDGLSTGGEGNDVISLRVGFCGGITPGHEAVVSGGEGAYLGVEAIGDDETLVVDEEAGDVFFVGLELVVGVVDVGVFGGGVFEFDDGDGEAVEEEDDVGAAIGVFVDGELVDGEPVVLVGLLEVNQPDLVVDSAVAVLVGDGDAIGEKFVESAIIFDQVLAFAADDLAQGFVDGVGGNVGVDADEGSVEPLGEDDFAIAVAFCGGFVGGDGGAVEDGVAKVF